MLKNNFQTLFAMLSLGFILPAFARDRIVIVSNDTVDWKINRVLGHTIYFTLFSGEVKTKSGISRLSDYRCSRK